MILLDTSVLLHVVGAAHPLAESARRRTRQDATALALSLDALALSLDDELVSADGAFADVPGLRWQPLLKTEA